MGNSQPVNKIKTFGKDIGNRLTGDGRTVYTQDTRGTNVVYTGQAGQTWQAGQAGQAGQATTNAHWQVTNASLTGAERASAAWQANAPLPINRDPNWLSNNANQTGENYNTIHSRIYGEQVKLQENQLAAKKSLSPANSYLQANQNVNMGQTELHSLDHHDHHAEARPLLNPGSIKGSNWCKKCCCCLALLLALALLALGIWALIAWAHLPYAKAKGTEKVLLSNTNQISEVDVNRMVNNATTILKAEEANETVEVAPTVWKLPSLGSWFGKSATNYNLLDTGRKEALTATTQYNVAGIPILQN